jgi:ABC-2 type transport system permease protein
LRRLRATPLPALQLVGAYLTVNVVIGVLQAVIIMVVSALFYQVPLTTMGVALALPMFIFSLLTFIAFGQVISGLVAKSTAAVALGQVAYFGQMFVTNLILPLDMMPAWLRTVAPYLPGYVAGDLMRSPLLSGSLAPHAGTQLVILLAYGIGAMLVAAKLFRWDPKA